MAKRKSSVLDALYLDGAPTDDLSPFAVPVGPSARRATGRKTMRRQKADSERPLAAKPRKKGPSTRSYAQSTANTLAGFTPGNMMSTGSRWGTAAGRYLREADDFGGDASTAWEVAKSLPGAIYDAAREDPLGFVVDMIPGAGTVDAIQEGAQLRDEGRNAEAFSVERNAGPIEMLGLAPFGAIGAGVKAGTKGAARAAVDAARPAYERLKDGPFTVVRRAGVEPEALPEATEARTLAALRGLAQDRSRSPAIRVADEASLAARGQPYDTAAEMPVSSLQRQAAMGRAYDIAARGDPDYKHAAFERYGEMMPEVVEQAGAQNYDQLTEAAYRALGDEVTQQFDRLPLSMRYHDGAGEYGSSTEMMQDALGRGQLNVFSGGEPHEFLSRVDPATGLSQNEMFRAVHDYLGHVVPASRFGPSGEEIAYAAHSQQLSPLAQMALLAETRGQNSFVNYTPVNADITGEMNALRRRRRELSVLDALQGQRKRSLAALRGQRGNYPSYDPAGMTDPDEIAKWRDEAYRDSRASRLASVRELRGLRDQLPSEEEIARRLSELGQQTQYAPQRALLLPPEYLDPLSPGGTPQWLREVAPPAAPTDARGVHISKMPDLEYTDPAFFGSGHRGEEYALASQMGLPRTYFYSGPEGSIRPEQPVLGMAGDTMVRGPRYAYEADLRGLYDVNDDPEGLAKLARAYNLPDYQPVIPETLQGNQSALIRGRNAVPDMERLVRDYNYAGYLTDFGDQRAAALYDPVRMGRSLGEATPSIRYSSGGRVNPATSSGYGA